MTGREAWLPDAADLFHRAGAIDALGDEADAALVHQAALCCEKDPGCRPSVTTRPTGSTAVYTALPGHRALLFTGSASDAEVVATIARRGGQTIVVGPPSTAR